MESEIYPKSTFKGKITGYERENGHYPAKATGELAIHGVTRKVEITGEMDVKQNELTLSATFPISLEDYDIEIPKILFSNIAENVDVTIEFIYKPYVTN
jgi:polyisoprenoid-binding protein YceI